MDIKDGADLGGEEWSCEWCLDPIDKQGYGGEAFRSGFVEGVKNIEDASLFQIFPELATFSQMRKCRNQHEHHPKT